MFFFVHRCGAPLRYLFAMARKHSTSKSDLSEYRRKRDFSRTPEPAALDAPSRAQGLRFVVQKHAATRLHYDLRLEMNGVLKSWALPRGPSLDPRQKPLAVHTEDHPMAYGDFEGVIPEGEYGGGTVMLWDRGTWEPVGSAEEGYVKGDLKFYLRGEKLSGAWALARMKGRPSDGGKNWLLIKKKDDAARSIEAFNVLGQRARSVATGRTMKDIAEAPEAVWKDGAAQQTGRQPTTPTETESIELNVQPSTLRGAIAMTQPEKLAPQLASTASEAPAGDDWLHEVKLDGYRLICAVSDGAARLFTRNGHDWTSRFAAIARSAARLPVDAILDGEVVILDPRGVADFQALQNAFRGYTPKRFVYYAFDMPFAGDFDLRRVALGDRKRCLEALLAQADVGPTIQFSDHIVGSGPTVFEHAVAAGHEGIISKRLSSAYESRRSHSWLKIKSALRQEFVVGAFTPPAGSRQGFGSLALGCYDGDDLIYCGNVGSGFGEQSLIELSRELGALRQDASPFAGALDVPELKQAIWVRPELVADVEFAAWTVEGRVRHARFKGLRPNVNPQDVHRESGAPAIPKKSRSTGAKPPRPKVVRATVVKSPTAPDDAIVSGVRISHPDRCVYPEDDVTKLEVAQYYECVADWILPHLVDRPLSLVRCPLGLAGDSFYQRHLGEGFPEAIHGVTVEDDPDGPSIVIRDKVGLLSLVQMGVLEIHPWGSQLDRIDEADRLIFDLDPGPGLKWGDVVGAAHFVHDYLTGLGLASFVKTTGGKGLHIVAPVDRPASWEEAKAFTHAVAKSLAAIAPRNFVAVMTKTLRKQRVFVDYLRNQRGATAVGPYSTRARDGACVSTPLSWGELTKEMTPDRFTVKTVPPRLESSACEPWKDFFVTHQSITQAMRQKVGLG